MIKDNYFILDQHIKYVLDTYTTNVKSCYNGYNFRCIICGDSKKNKIKTRGWVLKNSTPWMYYCHNCGVSIPVKKWLKDYYPESYRSYFRECMLDKPKEIKKAVIHKINRIRKPKSKDVECKNFKGILTSDTKIFKDAIEYVKKRKISDVIWKKWFIAVDGKYKNRLIIPFYNDKGKIYYYQARALFKTDNKYLNMVDNKDNAIYNYYNIDKTKPVVIFEGPIDSVFVENSIAVLGVKWSDKTQNKLNNLKCFYLLDNDKAGKEKSIKLLYKKEYVFLWKKFINNNNLPKREKWDINDIILYLNITKYKFEELMPYFSNSILNSMWI